MNKSTTVLYQSTIVAFSLIFIFFTGMGEARQKSGIYLIRSDGSKQQYIGNGKSAVFSKDGRKIFFLAYYGRTNQASPVIYDLDSRRIKRIPVKNWKRAFSYCISPNFKKILYNRYSGPVDSNIYI